MTTHWHETTIPCAVCRRYTLASTSRDTMCLACGDEAVNDRQTWANRAGHHYAVLAVFPDRRGVLYAALQRRRYNPCLISVAMLLRGDQGWHLVLDAPPPAGGE